MNSQTYSFCEFEDFEKTRTDVFKVALMELLKRKSQTNINIDVKVDNRSLSVIN